MYRNQELVYRTYYDNSGYYQNENLILNYLDILPELDRYYNYSISYSNSIGTLQGESFEYFMEDRIPHNITNLTVIEDFNYDYVNLVWVSYDRYNLSYYYDLYDRNNNFIRGDFFENLNHKTLNNQNNLVRGYLSNLSYYTNYSIKIRGYNEEYLTQGNYSNSLHFRTGPYYPPITHTPIIEFPYIHLNETSDINGPIELYILQLFCGQQNTTNFMFDMIGNTDLNTNNNTYFLKGFVNHLDIRNYTIEGDICNLRFVSFTTPNFQSISNYSEFIRIPTLSPSFSPTGYPTINPTGYPTINPTSYPTIEPVIVTISTTISTNITFADENNQYHINWYLVILCFLIAVFIILVFLRGSAF